MSNSETPPTPSLAAKAWLTLALLVVVAASGFICLIELIAIDEGTTERSMIRHWYRVNLFAFSCLLLLSLTALTRLWRRGRITSTARWLGGAQVLVSLPLIWLNVELLLLIVSDLDLPLGEILEFAGIFGGIPLLWIPLIYFLERSRRNWLRWIGRILFLGYLACSMILGITIDILFQILDVVGA